ncbi:MAG: type II toxin-antitoxin system RelE/ParE family toxin [Rhodospirillales bacterium]|nr:type II toxin-antitoxin system RelE/ParE family toxin [Rhodospirillales bacterium]
MMWDVEATGAFEEWWRALTEQEQDDVTAMVELLQERGPKLPFPYSSGIEGSKFSHMRELRVQSHGDPIRVFYAFDPRRVAVLLIGGIKTGKEKRFYKEYVPKADKLYEQHMKSLEG